ncbi:Peptidyl-prolyl cis-trans isomerase FKBP17-1, chloroplastic [Morella rubra]|uniref:peptidylprolyl isomerase n=1 Tax=Morella rubra TaxID=262757 RepID=A0A6A1WEH7_9ROSI|nr:Peptidyl-prolyl cis-trans isomerase FKBP17-1, chloroplastic [Morella rubra]
MILQCSATVQRPLVPHHPKSPSNNASATTSFSSSYSLTASRRTALSLSVFSTIFSTLIYPSSASSSSNSEFSELPNSSGVKVLDLRLGSGEVPGDGDQVAVHYYGRLAAKQGWRFDSTYDHKDENGEPIPFVFFLGSGKVISGIEAAVRSMKVGGIRRVIIPPSQGYQSTSQEPIPPNVFDQKVGQTSPWVEYFLLICLLQRLFTTIFNPTRLANGEGSTLGTLIFDIELVSLWRQ